MNGIAQVAQGQYMTNVQGAESEAAALRNGYASVLDTSMTFLIPVYDNLPSKAAALPADGEEEIIEPTEPEKPDTPDTPDKPEEEAANQAKIQKYKDGLAKTEVINLKAEAGRKKVKLTWKKSASGYAVDTYQIWRSVKKSSGYSKIFTSSNPKSCYYINTKGLSPNTSYWYKVRGVRTVCGKTLYTPFTKINVKTQR